MTMLRSVSLLALASCALSAHALDAFSNLSPPPNTYNGNGAFTPRAGGRLGFQFTSGQSGGLSGFQVAINQSSGRSATAFTLDLYADSGTDTLGTLLGTYAGTSTGERFGFTSSALSTVAASGPSLAAGGKYWLVATVGSDQVWNDGSGPSNDRIFINDSYINGIGTGAFSVQVDPISPTVPGPLAALPFALMAIKRRKRA